MTWDKGFNFRATAGFVTDGTNETYVVFNNIYPFTQNGVTFGWDVAPSGGIDRNAALDRRLAGIVHMGNTGTQRTFRVDLPSAADYTIRIALGDAGGAQAYQYLQVKDGTTVRLTIDDTNGTVASHWDDATGTDYTDVTWPGSNTAVQCTFAGTVLNLVIGSPVAQTNSTTISHLFISQVAAAVNAVPPDRAHSALHQNLMAS